MLVKGGAFAIEQLSEALSVSAESNKLSDGLPQTAVQKCADQVMILYLAFSNYHMEYICCNSCQPKQIASCSQFFL